MVNMSLPAHVEARNFLSVRSVNGSGTLLPVNTGMSGGSDEIAS
jgi:hypothetical protein